MLGYKAKVHESKEVGNLYQGGRRSRRALCRLTARERSSIYLYVYRHIGRQPRETDESQVGEARHVPLAGLACRPPPSPL